MGACDALDLDAVPQHEVIVAPVLDRGLARGLGNNDPERQVLHDRAKRRATPLVQELAGGVEGADHRAAIPEQRAQAGSRHRGLVQVHDVRLHAPERLGGATSSRTAGRDRRDRPVRFPLDGRPDADDRRIGWRAVARRDDPHVHVELPQFARQPEHLALDPSGP